MRSILGHGLMDFVQGHSNVANWAKRRLGKGGLFADQAKQCKAMQSNAANPSWHRLPERWGHLPFPSMSSSEPGCPGCSNFQSHK